MKIQTYILLSILLFSLNLHSQELKKRIVFYSTPNKQILSTKTTSQGNSQIKIINKFIIDYQDKGYISIAIDTIITSLHNDTVKITLGNRYTWKNIQFRNIPKEILSELKLRNTYWLNQPTNINEYRIKMIDILNYYEDNGYPFIEISPDSVILDSNSISAVINLKPNQLYKIDSIIIISNTKINKKYISNYLNIQQGMLYNQSLIEKVDDKIKNNPFYALKKPSEIKFYPSQATLVLYLEKKQVNNFNGIIGILPNEKDKGGLNISGDIALYLANSFNKAEIFDLKWKRIAKASQELDLKASYPYLFNTSFGVDGKIYLFKQDSSFLNVEQQIGLFYQANYNSTLKIFINKKNSSILRNSLQDNPDFNNLNILYYGSKIHYTKLNHRQNPSQGIEIIFEGKGGNKIINDPKSSTNSKTTTSQYILSAEFKHFIPLYKKFVFLYAIQSASMMDAQLYKNEIFRIGGASILRGFDEKSIYASDYSILTNEIRYILESNSFLFLFSDWGWYQKKTKNSSYIKDKPIGIGAGICFDTRAGVFSISYALGKQLKNPFDLQAAKVHFGLNAYF